MVSSSRASARAALEAGDSLMVRKAFLFDACWRLCCLRTQSSGAFPCWDSWQAWGVLFCSLGAKAPGTQGLECSAQAGTTGSYGGGILRYHLPQLLAPPGSHPQPLQDFSQSLLFWFKPLVHCLLTSDTALGPAVWVSCQCLGCSVNAFRVREASEI